LALSWHECLTDGVESASRPNKALHVAVFSPEPGLTPGSSMRSIGHPLARRSATGRLSCGVPASGRVAAAVLLLAIGLVPARASQVPSAQSGRADAVVVARTRRVQLAAGIVVVSAQFALIGALLAQRSRRRRAEIALRASEEQYRNVINTQTE